jgi:mRNA interferase MazF
MTRILQIRDIITARFPEQNPQGHEQEGIRPAIVVGIPNPLGKPRFPVIIVVPLTSDRCQNWIDKAPALYPRLPEGIAGLRSPSIALLDQIRSIDVERILKYRGSLTTEEYEPILLGLQSMLDCLDSDIAPTIAGEGENGS